MFLFCGVHDYIPFFLPGKLRQGKFIHSGMEIIANIDHIIRPASIIHCIIPTVHHTKCSLFFRESCCPGIVRMIGQIRTSLMQIIVQMHRFRFADHRMSLTECCKFLYELLQRLHSCVPLPIHPSGFVILTICIIIALLGIQCLIPCKEQRHSLCKKHHGQRHI